MTWLSYVFLGAIVAGHVAYARTYDAHPLAPYAAVGSYTTIPILNNGDDTLRVWVIAPKVDNAIRWMGLVPPHDTASLRVPYVSTKVTLLCFIDNHRGGFIFEKKVP